MSIDLRHFRSFVAVAEERNIGRAAQRLFITQPALSRQIQQLERSLGTTLLVRSSRGVELTEAGQELLVKARHTLEAVDDALTVGSHDEPRGRLALGLPLAGLRDQWYALCEAFVDRYPQIEIEVRQALSENLQRQVAAGELDGALTLAPSRQPLVTYTRVREDTLGVWMNREHPMADRDEITLDDFRGQTITLIGGAAGAGSGFNAAVRGLFDGTGIAPHFAETTDVFPARAIRDPGYLGISPALEFPGDVVGARLVPEQTMGFEFVHRADSARAAVRAFGPFAREHFREAAAEPCQAGMPRA